MGGRGGFEEEVEDGCGRLTDKAAAAPSKRRRIRKRDKAATNNDDGQSVHNNQTEYGGGIVGGRRRRLIIVGGNVSRIFMFSVFCFHVCEQRSVKRSHGQKKREEKK